MFRESGNDPEESAVGARPKQDGTMARKIDHRCIEDYLPASSAEVISRGLNRQSEPEDRG
jgi:hypothetical protein